MLWFLQMHTNKWRITDMGRNVLHVHILVTVIYFLIVNTWLEFSNNNKKATKTNSKDAISPNIPQVLEVRAAAMSRKPRLT